MPEKLHVALTKCFYCGEDDRILLATKYHHTKDGMQPVKDLQPLHNKIIDMEPCRKCADWMEQGIILLGIDSAKSEPNWNKPPAPNAITGKQEHWLPNPWRSGTFSVVKEEAFRRMVPDKAMQEFALKRRFMFMEEEAMVMMGIIPAEGEKPDEGKVQPDGGVQEEVSG